MVYNICYGFLFDYSYQKYSASPPFKYNVIIYITLYFLYTFYIYLYNVMSGKHLKNIISVKTL